MEQKVAIPLDKSGLSAHFGESDQFVIFEINDGNVLHKNYVVPPPHKPGVFPKWLADFGITHMLAGNIGQRAMDHFQHYGITVIAGVKQKPIMELICDFINDQLTPGRNNCHRHH